MDGCAFTLANGLISCASQGTRSLGWDGQQGRDVTCGSNSFVFLATDPCFCLESALDATLDVDVCFDPRAAEGVTLASAGHGTFIIDMCFSREINDNRQMQEGSVYQRTCIPN